MLRSAAEIALLHEVFAGRRGLPARYFLDEQIFSAEMRDLFQGGWACIGFSDDVPAAGDVFPLEFAGLPLLMVRAQDGQLRVFHNSCRHRGARLATTKASGRPTLTCPYHCWSYRLDGQLLSTPHAGGADIHVTPEAPRSALGLKEVRSAQFAGHVFVDLSGKDIPFETFIAPVAQRMGHLDYSLMRQVPEFDRAITVAANWKAIIENYVESYHLPMIHPELESFNPMAAHYQILGGASYVGQAGTNYGRDTATQPPGLGLPVQPGFAGKSFAYEGLYTYPNVIFTPILQVFYTLLLLPVSAGQTVERLRFWVYGDDALAPDLAGERQAIFDAVSLINNQDIGIVEDVQIGRRSPAFEGGVFMTAQEATSLLVQRQIAGRLLAASGEAVAWESLPVMDIHHERWQAAL